MNGSRRQVTVNVGTARTAKRQRHPARLVLFAICGADTPWLVDAYPQFKVRETRFRSSAAAIEHLQITPGADLSLLPGLDGAQPSHVRDAVGLALLTGAPAVDLVAVRAAGAAPWQTWRLDAVELFESFSSDLQASSVLVPDALGPPQVGSTPPPAEARLENVYRTVHNLAQGLTDNYQVGLFDLPFTTERNYQETFRRLIPADVAMVAWEGTAPAIRRHGWRSGAALVGGILARQTLPSEGLAGVVVPVPGGRTIHEPRWPLLGRRESPQLIPASVAEEVVRLRLRGGAQMHATVESQPAMRVPLGNWNVPMMRTAKLIHHRVVTTADAFVFRESSDEQALALQAGLRMSLQAFVDVDLIGGPAGMDQPVVVTRAHPDPAQPALIASVAIFLKPWLRELRINVAVQHGQAPQVVFA